MEDPGKAKRGFPGPRIRACREKDIEVFKCFCRILSWESRFKYYLPLIWHLDLIFHCSWPDFGKSLFRHIMNYQLTVNSILKWSIFVQFYLLLPKLPCSVR